LLLRQEESNNDSKHTAPSPATDLIKFFITHILVYISVITYAIQKMLQYPNFFIKPLGVLVTLLKQTPAIKQQYHYATLTEPIDNLHQQGNVLDFNLETGTLIAGDNVYPAEEFEIADLYRYEGASDPADEATVYALVSKTGLKGLLVSGYGVSSDSASEETLKQLHYKYQQGVS
jgi:hypothetical protein